MRRVIVAAAAVVAVLLGACDAGACPPVSRIVLPAAVSVVNSSTCDVDDAPAHVRFWLAQRFDGSPSFFVLWAHTDSSSTRWRRIPAAPGRRWHRVTRRLAFAYVDCGS